MARFHGDVEGLGIQGSLGSPPPPPAPAQAPPPDAIRFCATPLTIDSAGGS